MNNEQAATLVKAGHTVVWVVVEGALVLLLIDGVRGRWRSRDTGAAAAVAAEIAVFGGFGWRCPLRLWAERAGYQVSRGRDIYLPYWLARHTPALTTGLVLATIAVWCRAWRR